MTKGIIGCKAIVLFLTVFGIGCAHLSEAQSPGVFGSVNPLNPAITPSATNDAAINRHKRPIKDEEVDVIIVGAGMAGLTAAKELKKAHKSFLVLEAQNRIGGRALVDNKFIVPTDLGASWFHGVEENPLVPVADSMGFHRVDSELNGPIYVENRRANKKELQACDKTWVELEHALQKTIASSQDVSVGSLLPEDKPCADLVASNIGPFENGVEVNRVSGITAGLFNSENDDFLKEGIATFVAAFGKDVPVRLNSVVNHISYDDQGVTVTLTSKEQFKGKRVLVTVSTGVLSSGKITFSPPLPDWKNHAIASLPMGLLNKVVLQFKKDIFKDTPQNSWVLWDGPADDNVAFVIRPFDAPMAIAFYGGEQAKNFEQSDEAALKHAKDVLRKMYGDEVDKEFEISTITKWGKNPWTLGSFSYVVPGASSMFKELLKPVDDRVFFAGEACGRSQFNASLHAAYESGINATKLLGASLATSK